MPLWRGFKPSFSIFSGTERGPPVKLRSAAVREYAKVAPQFWTGETGKRIRALGRDAQVVALYLVSSPSSTMLGFYYLPIPTLCHEIGISRQGALKALRSLSEAG